MVVVKTKFFVIVLSLIFSLPALAGGHHVDTSAISEASDTARAAKVQADAARATAQRAATMARNSSVEARRAAAIAREASARNERQADHAHLSRDYGATLWRHIWGDEGASPEHRKTVRKSGGFFSWVSAHENRLNSHDSQLGVHTIALWVIGAVALAALVLGLFNLFRPRGRREEDSEDGETPATSEESVEDREAEEEEDGPPAPPPEPDTPPPAPPVPDTDPEPNEGGDLVEAPEDLDEW